MDVKKLLNQMTLEQKLAQISQYNAICLHIGASGEITGPAEELSLTQDQIASVGSVLNFVGAKEMREIQEEHLTNDPLKIPMLFMHDVVHGYRTIYPIPLALGASFEPTLAEECCEMAAKEMSLGGVHVTFAPMVDLVRDPRWGRCMETTGEDPLLNCDMARAMVRGFQGDMTKPHNVAACVKHFAAYGQAEAGRDYNTTDISERTLRDFYLPAYKAAVDEGVEMVMTSFNILNGVPSSGNERLVKGILREEWGFDKVIISDYNAFREMHVHGYCETEYDCAEKAIRATSDIEMMSTCYLQNIPKLVEEGKVSEADIDKAVLRVLELKEKMGLLDNPYLWADEEEEKRVCLCEEHREIARRAAEKSAVLLKNQGVLPFSKNVKRVAVIGPLANKTMLGSWCCHGKEDEGVSVLQGVQKLLPNAQVFYAEGCGSDINETDCSKVKAAVKLAKKCDAVILCIGERSNMSGESMSRVELRLSKAQQMLIRETVKANPKTAAVMFNGRPLVLTDIIDEIPALMTAWQPGTEGGNAVANLLFGEVNFGAKLPMTFPRSEGQIPISYNIYRTGRPYQGPYGSWYQDMPNEPLFPFGYGLSYTNFEISKPTLDKTAFAKGEKLTVSVAVKNTGKVAGETVVQMYICDKYASLVRPVKELKGYKKVSLQAGEETQVAFEITEDTLKFWTANGKFEAEKGAFDVWVSDCSDATACDTFEFLG